MIIRKILKPDFHKLKSPNDLKFMYLISGPYNLLNSCTSGITLSSIFLLIEYLVVIYTSEDFITYLTAALAAFP